MRLIKVDVMGYRRFRETAEMDVAPDLVCVVGPNAAGKSSFLDGLTHLEHDEDFAPQERTRNAPAQVVTQARARYVLEAADKELLDGIPEAREARQLVLWKKQASGWRRAWSRDPSAI